MAERTDRTGTLLRGAVAGIGTAAVGYVLTWVLAGTRASRLTVGGPLGGAVPDWKAVAWVFFDSHLVGTRTPDVVGPGGPLGGGELFDTVALLDVTYLYVLPPVLLLAAGATVAALGRVDGAREGLLAGTTVSVGYLLIAVFLLLLATEGGVAPSPLRAVVIAGIVYPVAFGGLGGAAVGALGSGSTGSGSETAAQ